MNLKAAMTIAAFAAAAAAPIPAAAQKVGDIALMDGAQYMMVSELKTPEQNDLFNYNVHTMRRYAGKLKELQTRLREEKDEAKKAEIQKVFDALDKEFKANDEIMRKQYAFASNRKYKMIFLSSNICTALSKEELSNLKTSDGTQMDPMRIIQKNGANYYRLKSIEGTRENAELQRSLGTMLAQKAALGELRKEIASTMDAPKQMKLTKKLSEDEMAMKALDAELRRKYGISENKNYIVEIKHSQIWLELSPEELAIIKSQRAAEAKK